MTSKNNKNPIVIITTFNREESFWKSFNSIDSNIADICVVQDGNRISTYSKKFQDLQKDSLVESLIINVEQKGIGHSKKVGTQYALNNGYEDIFIVEDDVEITDNNIWKFCINFKNKTGLKHFNWNEAATNVHKATFNISGQDVDIHKNVQGSFSYFHKDCFDDCSWDDQYFNCYEHVDLEYQLIEKKMITSFWNFASPSKIGEYLKSDDSVESTITPKEGDSKNREVFYKNNLINAVNHWLNKWGNRPHPDTIPDKGLERTELRLKVIQNEFGVPDKKRRGRKPKVQPVSVVVCIKDRCLIRYKDTKDFLPQELALMQQHDQIMLKVHEAQKDMGGIILNQQLINNPEGFRPFDHFLKTLNKQSHTFEGDVELVVVDYSSKDDDVQELLELFWEHDVKYVQIPYEEKFSRGFALHKGIQEATHERLHISDVDVCYITPNPLIECSNLSVGKAIFPQIIKEYSPSSLFMHVETAGFGIASYTKEDYNNTKGYINKKSWGMEDERFWGDMVELLGRDNIKRTFYRDIYHQWHSNISRNQPAK